MLYLPTLPQRLTQLHDMKLQGRFHSVHKHGILRGVVLLRQGELSAEHSPYQLQQQNFLAGKDMEEGALPNSGRLCNLAGCCFHIPLFQKQPHCRTQHLLLGQKTA